jgi:hypothetical protein
MGKLFYWDVEKEIWDVDVDFEGYQFVAVSWS